MPLMRCIARPWVWPFLLLFLALIYLVRSQLRYENFLQSLSITFDDLPPKYTHALQSAEDGGGDLPDYNDWDEFNVTDADPSIPPIIHFIWFPNLYSEHLDVSEIPTKGSHAPELCEQYNANFTVNIWNATASRDLLEQHYAWFLPTYDAYRHPIQRVDAIKYFVLLHFGGIYMDLDIACRRSLTPLLGFPAWFPKAQPFGVNNDLMASRPGHPAIRRMTESLKSRNVNLIFPYLTIFWSTGPQFTSDILRKVFNDKRQVTYFPGENKLHSDPDNFYILSLPFYSEQYTFFGHSPGGTWHEDDVAVVLWLVDRPWVVAMLISLAAFGCFAYIYRRRWRRGRRRDAGHVYDAV